jgi:hypothetical protein
LLLVVVTSRISLVVAGVAIASHLAFEGLLAFAEETVHVEGWWIELLEMSRWERCGEQGGMIVKMRNEFIRQAVEVEDREAVGKRVVTPVEEGRSLWI